MMERPPLFVSSGYYVASLPVAPTKDLNPLRALSSAAVDSLSDPASSLPAIDRGSYVTDPVGGVRTVTVRSLDHVEDLANPYATRVVHYFLEQLHPDSRSEVSLRVLSRDSFPPALRGSIHVHPASIQKGDFFQAEFEISSRAATMNEERIINTLVAKLGDVFITTGWRGLEQALKDLSEDPAVPKMCLKIRRSIESPYIEYPGFVDRAQAEFLEFQERRSRIQAFAYDLSAIADEACHALGLTEKFKTTSMSEPIVTCSCDSATVSFLSQKSTKQTRIHFSFSFPQQGEDRNGSLNRIDITGPGLPGIREAYTVHFNPKKFLLSSDLAEDSIFKDSLIEFYRFNNSEPARPIRECALLTGVLKEYRPVAANVGTMLRNLFQFT